MPVASPTSSAEEKEHLHPERSPVTCALIPGHEPWPARHGHHQHGRIGCRGRLRSERGARIKAGLPVGTGRARKSERSRWRPCNRPLQPRGRRSAMAESTNESPLARSGSRRRGRTYIARLQPHSSHQKRPRETRSADAPTGQWARLESTCVSIHLRLGIAEWNTTRAHPAEPDVRRIELNLWWPAGLDVGVDPTALISGTKVRSFERQIAIDNPCLFVPARPRACCLVVVRDQPARIRTARSPPPPQEQGVRARRHGARWSAPARRRRVSAQEPVPCSMTLNAQPLRPGSSARANSKASRCRRRFHPPPVLLRWVLPKISRIRGTYLGGGEHIGRLSPTKSCSPGAGREQVPAPAARPRI